MSKTQLRRGYTEHSEWVEGEMKGEWMSERLRGRVNELRVRKRIKGNWGSEWVRHGKYSHCGQSGGIQLVIYKFVLLGRFVNTKKYKKWILRSFRSSFGLFRSNIK